MSDNNEQQATNEKSESNEKSKEERINKIISELNDLINDIKNSRQISNVILQNHELDLNQGTSPSEALPNVGMPTQSEATPAGQEAAQVQAPNTANTTANVNASILQTAQTLTALNTIKTELCRLPLDFCEREYIANCITPLETAMEFIARTGFELATSVSILTTSPIVPRKKGKLRDTIHTIYSINEEVEDIYKVLKNRLTKITEQDNCC